MDNSKFTTDLEVKLGQEDSNKVDDNSKTSKLETPRIERVDRTDPSDQCDLKDREIKKFIDAKRRDMQQTGKDQRSKTNS